ncbi:viral a-type inclusion protein repeat containing protein [Stylonychia lemnae]|uniref:Viral a-type inclusion protein repeat containing protein n=1 Tax=Stylonychia lemnae TaxID=5949 RepID=A0A078AKX5_STYLE|nr:viral a-type inclusion protein repeat containing protein [Stylonychia lemnae]|eukprot:CDW82092.1 viral a-type inclusion protein repeat containing protein [Stylonychia lemnae]
MSYFLSGLSKLKEQASNIQSMAKNIIVQQNQNDQEQDDEEILDAIVDDNSTRPPTAAIKEQADDFFNSFIPSLQQKSKTGITTDKTTDQEKHKNNDIKQISKTSKSEGRKTEANEQKRAGATESSNNGNKNNSKDIKGTKQMSSNYQEEEFEERIKAYQNILKDNEATIDSFRSRVVSLEQQIKELQPKQAQTESTDSQSQQIDILLEVIQKERQLSQAKDHELNLLNKDLQVSIQKNNNFENEFGRQISEIESILSNLVQSQIASEQNQNQENGGGKNKKGKKQNNSNAQSQNQTIAQNSEILSKALSEIIYLLKPRKIFEQNIYLENAIRELEQNNVILREVNFKISDKLLSLEKVYQDKIQLVTEDLQTEHRLKIKSIEEQNELLKLNLEKDFQDKLSDKLMVLNEKIDQQEKDFTKQSKEQEKVWSDKLQVLENSYKQESLEQKKHIINQCYQTLTQSLTKVFEIQEKLAQNDDVQVLVNTYNQLIKDNYKGTLQLDPSNIITMKECWEQVNERFKQLNLSKFQKQAIKDAQQWLNQRFGSLPKAKKKEDDFRESELYKFFDTQLQLTLQLNLYIQDQQLQFQDLTSKKDTLQSQFTKLQKECNDMLTKSKEIPKLKEKQDQLAQEKEVIQNQLQEVLQQKLDFQMKLEEGRNKTEMLVVENATLKEKVSNLDEEIKRLRKQIKQLQGQNDLQEDYKLQHEKAQQEIKWQEAQIKSKEGEIEEARKTVSLLQRAIQQQQDEYDQNLRLKEREQAEDKALLQTLQISNNEMKERIREIVEIQNQLQLKEEINQDLHGKLQKCEIENLELKKYSQELVEKVKKDSEQSEFMVDRRMINKFLINYVNPNSSRDVKFQMLDAMSKILGFTMEEKQSLGLIKKPTTLDAGAEQQNTRGIGEKLINFFLQDDDDE